LYDAGPELQPLREWVESLPGVTKAPHRFGGVEFQVHGLEFVHFHSDAHLDAHLSKEDQAEVLKEKKTEPHQFAPEAGWVTIRIRCPGDLTNAREVVHLAYSRAKAIVESHLARRGKKIC
jgi:Luciferase